MDNKTLESFIDFCDTMEIATEEHSTTDKAIAIGATALILGALSIPEYKKRKRERQEREQKQKEQAARIKAEKKEIEEFCKTHNEEDYFKLAERMQKDGISHLKKYISTPAFKKKYKECLHLIKITPEDYGDPYSIQITEYQDGVDYAEWSEWEKKNPGKPDHDNPWRQNDWYYELLNEGVKYLKEKYKNEIAEWGIHFDTGEGDEGNIYISSSKACKLAGINKK